MRLATLLILATSTLAVPVATAQSYPGLDVYGTDALGRSMPSPGEVRAFQQDRYVGIFYFLWLLHPYVHDSSLILKEHPDAQATSASPPWGPVHAYHHWGEPMFGYYRSDDPWVIRRHAALLSDAGVDFLIFDTTNAAIYESVVTKIIEVFEEQRNAGEHVPQLAFMVNTRAGETAQTIYEKFYKPGQHDALWFQWKGKPLIICDPADATEEVKSFFTLRKAHWPTTLVDTHNAWHWEATYPQVYSYDTDPAKPEQVNVSVGQNLHEKTGRVEMMSTGHARGRSYHDGKRDDRPEAYKHGFNFGEQWKRAHELDPEVVFVTGWNEWIAMQLNKEAGPAIFCDQYNLEFSRDVEMMKGGHGDNYYMQMAANIRRFKGMDKPKAPSAPKSIDMAGPFTQWQEVRPAYSDHVNDTIPRDFAGCGDEHYMVDSGRNDFETLKVARDDETLYFYAKTRKEISAHTGPGWMWLLISVKGSGKPAWEGFNFLVNRQVRSAASTTLEACAGGWKWESAGTVNYRVEDNQIQIAIPKTLLGLKDGPVSIEFKWVDNILKPWDILDCYVNGDAAPGGRFRYRYDAP